MLFRSHAIKNPDMDFKQALAQLIDAYADAKASKNQILLSYATQELQNFIQQVEISAAAVPQGQPEENKED